MIIKKLSLQIKLLKRKNEKNNLNLKTMKITAQKISFEKEVIDLGDDVLYIEINGIQIQVKGEYLVLKTEESLILEPTSSNNILIKSKTR